MLGEKYVGSDGIAGGHGGKSRESLDDLVRYECWQASGRIEQSDGMLAAIIFLRCFLCFQLHCPTKNHKVKFQEI